MRWLLISPSGTPVSSCDAPDLTMARERLGWRVGMVTRVQSQASWDLSFAPMRDGVAERKRGRDYRERSGMPKRMATHIPTGAQMMEARDAKIRARASRDGRHGGPT